MKTTDARFALMICFGILSSALVSSGQTNCQSNGRQADVLKAVQSEKTGSDSMNLTPEPELRDDAISLEQDFAGHLLLADLCFFEFTPERYKLSGNEISAVTVQFDDDNADLYVASSEKTIYLLHGFESSPLNFGRLMLDLHMKVDSPDKAMSVFNFYSKVVYGKAFRAKIVGDNLHLISVAAEDFRLRYSGAIRDREFRMWRESKNFKSIVVRPPQARKVEGRYEINYFYYKAGGVHPVSLFVDSNGQVSDH